MSRRDWITTIYAIVLLALGVFTLVRGEDTRTDVGGVTERIRVIEQGDCQRAPASRACARIRREIAREEPIRNPCISFRRIVRPRSVYQRFTRCAEIDRQSPTPGENDEGQQPDESDPESSSSSSAADASADGDGSGAAGDAGGGGGDDDVDGGGPEPSPPADPGEPVAPDPPTPEAPDPPDPGGGGGLGDDLGGIVDDVVGGADDATGGAVCSLAPQACP